MQNFELVCDKNGMGPAKIVACKKLAAILKMEDSSKWMIRQNWVESNTRNSFTCRTGDQIRGIFGTKAIQ